MGEAPRDGVGTGGCRNTEEGLHRPLPWMWKVEQAGRWMHATRPRKAWPWVPRGASTHAQNMQGGGRQAPVGCSSSVSTGRSLDFVLKIAQQGVWTSF